MIYAKIENPEEKKHLEDALKASKNKGWYRHLQVIQNSANGITVPKLSEIFSICQQTVRNYINAYDQGGLDGLMPEKQSGRPLTPFVKAVRGRFLLTSRLKPHKHWVLA
jgi:hypothetical protein